MADYGIITQYGMLLLDDIPHQPECERGDDDETEKSADAVGDDVQHVR
jgi:hypothetical protein